MLFLLIAGALVVVVAMLGMGMCRVAALSDRNGAVALTEWLATGRLADSQGASPDSVGEQQFLFDPPGPGEAFRAAG